MKKTWLPTLFAATVAAALISFNASAQQRTIDSLYAVLKTQKSDTDRVNTLNRLSKIYMNSAGYKQCDSLCQAALSLSNKLNYAKGSMIAYNVIGNTYFYRGRYPEAVKAYTLFLKYAEKAKSKKGIANAYGNIGAMYYLQGNYPEALNSQLTCLKMQIALGNKQNAGNAYNNIGDIYELQNDLPNAMYYFTKALNIEESIGNKRGMANAYSNIGTVSILQTNYAEGLKNELQCLALSKETNNKTELCSAYINIADIYEMQGNYPKAAKNYLYCLTLSKQIGDKNRLALSYIGLALLNIKQKNNSKAKEYLNKSWPIIKRLNDITLWRNAYRYQAFYDSATGKYKAAFADYKMYAAYRDSIINSKQTKKLMQEQMNFNFRQKEVKLKAAQDEQTAISRANLKKQKIITASASGTLGFALLISILLFNRFRLKQKNKYQQELNKKQKEQAIAVMETQEQERKRIAEDLHDGMGHLLSTVKLNLQTPLSEQKYAIESSLQCLNLASQEMHNITFNLMPKTLEEDGFVEALHELVARINTPNGVKVFLHLHDVESLSGLEKQVQFNLYRIVQETVNNALKYADAHEIVIQLSKQEEHLLVMVEDDGKGFNMKAVKKGSGLKNIASRTEWLNGRLSIDSTERRGTTIIIEVPLQTWIQKSA